MTAVRLTYAARCRWPDIGTRHGMPLGEGQNLGGGVPGPANGWRRVEWPGERITWLRAEDLVPVRTEQPEEPAP